MPRALSEAHGPADLPDEPRRLGSGFADVHLHITANLRAGGAVIYGEPFDRFGISR